MSRPRAKQFASPTPTPSAWGGLSTTMSGTLVLTDASDTVHFLDPDGAARVVQLPAITANTPFFFLVNVGAGGFGIAIEDSNGIEQATLANGAAFRVWHDGASVLFTEASGALTALDFTGGKLAYFYATINTCPATFFLTTNRGGNSASATNQTTEHTMNEAGTIEYVFFHVEIASSLAFKVYKNGAAADTSPASQPTDGSYLANVAVSVGDQIALQVGAGSSNTGASTGMIVVTPTSGTFTTYSWGGNLSVTTRRLATNGASASTVQVGDTHASEHAMLEACSADSLSWNSASATASTDLNINKNGALSEIVNATGATGRVGSLSSSFVAADRVSIQVNINTPGQMTATLACSGTGGVSIPFGGDAGATTNFFQVSAIPLTFLSTNGAHPFTQIPVPAGIINRMSVHRQTAAAGDAFQLYKNGASSEISSATSTTANEILTFTDTTYAKDDLLALKADTAVGSNDTTLRLLLRVNG